MANQKKLEDNHIYAWSTEYFLEQDWEGDRHGKGWLKVGEAINANDRIRGCISLPGVKMAKRKCLEASAKYDDGKGCFSDHDVHRMLEKSFNACNIPDDQGRKTEWYECTIEEVEAAILAVKYRKKRAGTATKDFPMRDEQKAAVDQTEAYFKQCQEKPAHFLWNAKMRFGKTFAAYQLAKKMDWKKILVLTFKPAVRSQWRGDLYSHVDFVDWQFVSNESDSDPSEEFEKRDKTKPIVWFASFQDMLGEDGEGNTKPHNLAALNTEWDCVILDEYHFGAWRDSAKELFAAESKAESDAERDDSANFKEDKLKAKHFLYLSGTPFRAIADKEFGDEQIFNWTYADERRAKKGWDPTRGPNPYDELPEMRFYLYRMSELFQKVAADPESDGFDLNEFFRATESKVEKGKYQFDHAHEVQAWLDQIFHIQPDDVSRLKEFLKTKPISPFGDPILKDELRHTLWFLPSVASCKAMGQMLQGKYKYGSEPYTVVVCAGNQAGIGDKALDFVKKRMLNPNNTATITLTCGKLTTGVTVPAWSGILMLRNTTSPETYFQAAFRIQSPWTEKDELDQTKKIIKKPVCYVFDYAPDRALTEIAEYAVKLANNIHGDPIKQIEEFINYLPVLCDKGGQMCGLDAKSIFFLTTQGGSQSLLARRWASKRLVTINDKNMALLLGNKKLTELLKGIKDIDGKGNKLTEILNDSKVLKKLKKKLEAKTNGGQNNSDNDPDLDKLKEAYRKKLQRINATLPVYMYLTDPVEKCFDDLLASNEDELFAKVLNLDKNSFRTLVEENFLDVSRVSYNIAGFSETDRESKKCYEEADKREEKSSGDDN